MARDINGEAGDLFLNMLPEGCIANMLSFTFFFYIFYRSGAESDADWERFLPYDYQSIISKSDNPQLVSSSASSTKQLHRSL